MVTAYVCQQMWLLVTDRCISPCNVWPIAMCGLFWAKGQVILKWKSYRYLPNAIFHLIPTVITLWHPDVDWLDTILALINQQPSWWSEYDWYYTTFCVSVWCYALYIYIILTTVMLNVKRLRSSFCLHWYRSAWLNFLTLSCLSRCIYFVVDKKKSLLCFVKEVFTLNVWCWCALYQNTTNPVSVK